MCRFSLVGLDSRWILNLKGHIVAKHVSRLDVEFGGESSFGIGQARTVDPGKGGFYGVGHNQVCQKRPSTEAKETYYQICQKRPMALATTSDKNGLPPM